MTERRVRVRVVGLVFAQGRVLIVEHRVGDERWWCFPGGTLEPGETPEEGVARELREELGLACEVGTLAAVGTHVDGPDPSVELYFRCVAREAALVSRDETVVSAAFVEVGELRDRGVFPVELAADLATGGIGDGIRYYGGFGGPDAG